MTESGARLRKIENTTLLSTFVSFLKHTKQPGSSDPPEAAVAG
jgi:hypothetical protein